MPGTSADTRPSIRCLFPAEHLNEGYFAMIPNPVLNRGGAGVRFKGVGLARRQRDFC